MVIDAMEKNKAGKSFTYGECYVGGCCDFKSSWGTDTC